MSLRPLLLLVSTLLLAAPPVCAQATGRPLVVMNLAAHPDDEDGATLTYYRRAEDAVAYSVIFTRGEGGQNEIGPELYEELGAIRTLETERAARVLGTQVFFLNYPDFGYSKFAREAFDKWGGRDSVTARLVYLVRKLKPDVLFTNHDTVTVGPQAQHGQHQAVGLAAYDAFALAADPEYHPEQLEEPGVDLWQPARLFLRRWNETEETDVSVPIGDVHPETGEPYAATAARALHEHASQGMEMFADRVRGMTHTHFELLRSAVDAPPGAHDLAAGLRPNAAAAPDLTYRIDAGRVPALPEGTLRLDDSLAVPGQRVRLSWRPGDLPSRRVRWQISGAVDTTLYLTDDAPGTARLRVLPEAEPTVPRHVYQYRRFRSGPPAWYALYVAGTDSLLAAGYLPLEIAPPLFVEAVPEVVRLRPGENEVPVRIRTYDPAAERVTLQATVARDADRRILLSEQRTLAPERRKGAVETLSFTLPDGLTEGDYTVRLTAMAEPPGRGAAVHEYLPGRVFDVDVPAALRVGVVESYDNTMARALEELGVEHVLLDSAALARGDFDGLHTIVVDIRSYLVRPGLRAHNGRLLEWVRGGGHLVVNYQKTFEWNEGYPDPFVEGRTNPGTFAPYPLVLGRDRVTYEDAEVELLVPGHPLLHRPNEIGPGAWRGWVQERGLYFPESYDDRYVELFAMHDPGEAALRSSTLLAEYGEGTYLYTALVWYRQLKVFHPGAYALFANMISLPLVDDRSSSASSR